MKLLIIDDDSSVRKFIATTLKKENYTVIEAENGAEGLKAFTEHAPDIVITDILMPVMDGFELLRWIRGRAEFARVPLGDSDALAVGDRVFAIGSPLGLERTVTEGILSTKTRQMQGSLYLQTTTQINPGNSGGPLFNLRGEVVGVTNMKITFGEGLGFAIPVEQVKYFLGHRDAYAYDADNPSNAYRYLPPPNRTKQAPAKSAP